MPVRLYLESFATVLLDGGTETRKNEGWGPSALLQASTSVQATCGALFAGCPVRAATVRLSLANSQRAGFRAPCDFTRALRRCDAWGMPTG